MSVLKTCLLVLSLEASHFLIISFDSVVQADILTVERPSTREYHQQQVLSSCCFTAAYLTWIFLAHEPTMQPLLYRLQMSDAFYLNKVSSCVLGEWLGTWACVRDRLHVVLNTTDSVGQVMILVQLKAYFWWVHNTWRHFRLVNSALNAPVNHLKCEN
jgi:hypothetical protein